MANNFLMTVEDVLRYFGSFNPMQKVYLAGDEEWNNMYTGFEVSEEEDFPPKSGEKAVIIYPLSNFELY